MVAAAGGVAVPRTSAIPPWVLRASGVVSREMRDLAETSYMFTAPFVMDSSASEERLGLAPTPMADGLATTVAWWRAQERAAA
jgi:nucleoside-diphosphate-sugar epimerase